MDRTLVYAGQVPRALDNLLLGRFAMVGLAQLSAAILGTSTIVSQGGFAVTPGGGLNIAIGAGQIYELESIEGTVESALNVDGHQVLKQGVALDAQTQTLAPPTTTGYAQNFLLQVAYQDIPTGATVLSFQNPTPVLDPSTNTYKYVTYPGPGGNGAASYTILQGGVSVIPKPGTAAPSGTQTTPAPDPGYVGLCVITLAYGATSVSSGNISAYANAPFIPVTLPGVPAGVQAGTWTFGQDTGTADNYAVTLSPNSGAPVANQRVFVKFANTNATTTPVFSLNGSGNKALLKSDGTSPAVGDVPARWRWIFYDGASWRFEGSVASDNTAAAAQANATALIVGNRLLFDQSTSGTYSYTVPAGVYTIRITLWAGGGAGGGSYGSGAAGGGGGGGGYSEGAYAVTLGQVLTIIVGGGGAGSATTSSGGGNGLSGSSSSVSGSGVTGLPIGATGGGAGGGGLNTITQVLGYGGSASGGQTNRPGNSGGGGVSIPGGPLSGVGGSTYSTSNASGNQGTGGTPGTFPGGGGAGASNPAGAAGGNGANGWVRIFG